MIDLDLTDLERLKRMFAAAGDKGVFSGAIRGEGISGNPSERIREMKDEGYTFYEPTRERYPSGGNRWGVRYRIASYPSQTAAVSVRQATLAAAPAPRHALDDDYDFDKAA